MFIRSRCYLIFAAKLSTIIVGITAFSAYAAVTYSPPIQDDKGLYSTSTITVTGVITDEDAKQFLTLSALAEEASRKVGYRLAGKKYGIVRVELNSLGGELGAAMSIGQQLRKLGGWAVVEQGSRCASSCVLILAGAVHRYVNGEVGIHRPYFGEDKVVTESGQKSAYKGLEMRVHAYLESVNVPASLYDRMVRIPPEKVHWLSRQELESYSLSEDDPYEHEAETARLATGFGMSKKEYLKLLSDAANRCQSEQNYEDCYSNHVGGALAAAQRKAVK